MEQPNWMSLSPMHLWRDWIAKNEAQWSETVSRMLKDEHISKVLNRQLGEMQLMHRQFSELAQASLAVANLPSRSDFEALDERMGRLEDGMARLSAAVSDLSQALLASPSFTAPTSLKRPVRTRKAPQAAMNTGG